MSKDHYAEISPARGTVTVTAKADGGTLAASKNALKLTEFHFGKVFPPVFYIPREDIDFSHLVKNQGQLTHCPIKGEASYYSLEDRVPVARDLLGREGGDAGLRIDGFGGDRVRLADLSDRADDQRPRPFPLADLHPDFAIHRRVGIPLHAQQGILHLRDRKHIGVARLFQTQPEDKRDRVKQWLPGQVLKVSEHDPVLLDNAIGLLGNSIVGHDLDRNLLGARQPPSAAADVSGKARCSAHH